MGLTYKAISWNSFKKKYDTIAILTIAVFCFIFVLGNLVLYPEMTFETILIRTSGTVSITLLHFILIIGPLSRFYPSFLPLLYNRRHLGVMMFLFASVHGLYSVFQFHALGNGDPFLSVFQSRPDLHTIEGFPFQILGLTAWSILFFMAATSHDFWLKNLGPKKWKFIHMLVYPAMLLIYFHVLFGALQYETASSYFVLITLGFLMIAGAHLAAGYKALKISAHNAERTDDNLIKVAKPEEISDKRARIIHLPGGNQAAVFRYEGKASALSNYCKHQGGPLGEGRIIDGCVTCPWHGYQYLPHNGRSPLPFKEKVSTYQLFLINGYIFIDPTPLPEGSQVAPLQLEHTI